MSGRAGEPHAPQGTRHLRQQYVSVWRLGTFHIPVRATQDRTSALLNVGTPSSSKYEILPGTAVRGVRVEPILAPLFIEGYHRDTTMGVIRIRYIIGLQRYYGSKFACFMYRKLLFCR